jgi:hypothetical protein
MQSSKITYEGPTQYEILHLISCYNAAHHDVDHIWPVGFTDLDTAKAESLASLDAQSWWRNPNFEIDSLILSSSSFRISGKRAPRKIGIASTGRK